MQIVSVSANVGLDDAIKLIFFRKSNISNIYRGRMHREFNQRQCSSQNNINHVHLSYIMLLIYEYYLFNFKTN